MSRLKYISLTAIAIISMMMVTVRSLAQTTVPDAVYYVCAEQGFKLSGPAGYDNYLWQEDNQGMPGADSNNIQVNALGASTVGNSYVTKTYHLKVQSGGSCWSDAADYVVYILPKMELSVTGYLPPYCENLSHDITLSARINSGDSSSALTLPQGVDVKYTWVVEPNTSGSLGWNAAIFGPINGAKAQVVTPETSNTDNNYTLKVGYTYPPTVNVNTSVVGFCSDSYTQNVHADPAPPTPSINYQAL
jgi:hypothetical protein